MYDIRSDWIKSDQIASNQIRSIQTLGHRKALRGHSNGTHGASKEILIGIQSVQWIHVGAHRAAAHRGEGSLGLSWGTQGMLNGPL